MSLVARGLGITAGGQQVLWGVDLAIARGEVLGIAGASGAGKSLIAAALAGLTPEGAHRHGAVTVAGRPPAPRAVALAPQRLDALDPLAPVGRQIRRLGGRGADPAALLARVGLPPSLARAYPHTLSGGMARRALLATALATGAEWIVADEPTVGLDPDAADRIMALLATLAAAGHGLAIVSHDLIRLARVARRILVLRDGRPVETAPATAFAGAGGALRSRFARDLWRAQLACGPC